LRTPAFLALLLGYPILVASLITLALTGTSRKPNVAVVNLDASGRTVQVGKRRYSVDDYLGRLGQSVRPRHSSAARAPSSRRRHRVPAARSVRVLPHERSVATPLPVRPRARSMRHCTFRP
jgi:hypothetical protein